MSAVAVAAANAYFSESHVGPGLENQSPTESGNNDVSAQISPVEEILQDFHIIATLEEYPEYSDPECAPSGENIISDDCDPKRQVKDILALRTARNLKFKLKKSGDSSRNRKEDLAYADEFNVKVIVDPPSTALTSALKKTQAKNLSVKIALPPNHKTGYHPVRTETGAVYLKSKVQRSTCHKVRRKAVENLFNEILSPKRYNNGPLRPVCPVNHIITSPYPIMDFVILVNFGPNDFFVRIGMLEVRRRFNYMESEMKLWYTRKRDLMEYCSITLEKVDYKGYYVMFHSRFNEFLRVQVSSPVNRNPKNNPNKLVTVALIDYGGHIETTVNKLRPLMPYFGQFPKMAFRGVLSLTNELEKIAGRKTYTENEEKVFRNLIADYNGVVEAICMEPKYKNMYDDYDSGTFGVVELVICVMSNGKRRSIDEIIMGCEEEQSVYLREPSHYPSIEDFREKSLTQLF